MVTHEPGSLLGSRYRVGEPLGAGHMGKVYKGVDTRLSREVAIKILNPIHARDERFVERFNREARIIAQLSENPHVVTIYDVGDTQDGLPFLVTEYLRGKALTESIGSPTSRTWVIEVGAQILCALVDAHERGVVHRDLKPANIIVTMSTTLPMLTKVLDFGLSRSSYRQGSAELTQPGTLLGTPRYMAPEVLSGETSGPAMDIYALGVVLYELATGRFPYNVGSQAEYLRAHIAETPQPFPPEAVPFPDSFESLVVRMLRKVPDERPTAPDCFRELLRLVDAIS